jgi:cleavage and polyadenylation specificity factor subunit 3
VTKVDFGVKV